MMMDVTDASTLIVTKKRELDFRCMCHAELSSVTTTEKIYFEADNKKSCLHAKTLIGTRNGLAV